MSSVSRCTRLSTATVDAARNVTVCDTKFKYNGKHLKCAPFAKLMSRSPWRRRRGGSGPPHLGGGWRQAWRRPRGVGRLRARRGPSPQSGTRPAASASSSTSAPLEGGDGGKGGGTRRGRARANQRRAALMALRAGALPSHGAVACGLDRSGLERGFVVRRWPSRPRDASRAHARSAAL